VLRAGAGQGALGHGVLAPSALETFMRSFRFGHVRNVGGELLQRAWAAGSGPGAKEHIMNMDSPICEVYGLHKQQAGSGYIRVSGHLASSREQLSASGSTTSAEGAHWEVDRVTKTPRIFPGSASLP